jgi:hypothetical protein
LKARSQSPIKKEARQNARSPLKVLKPDPNQAAPSVVRMPRFLKVDKKRAFLWGWKIVKVIFC